MGFLSTFRVFTFRATRRLEKCEKIYEQQTVMVKKIRKVADQLERGTVKTAKWTAQIREAMTDVGEGLGIDLETCDDVPTSACSSVPSTPEVAQTRRKPAHGQTAHGKDQKKMAHGYTAHGKSAHGPPAHGTTKKDPERRDTAHGRPAHGPPAHGTDKLVTDHEDVIITLPMAGYQDLSSGLWCKLRTAAFRKSGVEAKKAIWIAPKGKVAQAACPCLQLKVRA